MPSLSPAPVPEQSKGVVPTKPPRYYSEEEQEGYSDRDPHSDKQTLIRKEPAVVSSRDAYEEPPSDDESEGDGFVETEPVNPVPKQVNLSASSSTEKVKSKYDPKEYTYEDVDKIRARKAKEREEKARKQSKQQTVFIAHSTCMIIMQLVDFYSMYLSFTGVLH